MLVLLIGLVYSENKKGYKELLGSFVDLYNFYSYFSKLTKNVYLLTDIIDPESTQLGDAVAEGIIPDQVISFHRRLLWEKRLFIYSTPQDLYDFLKIGQEKELFLYFSGHCKQGDLLFPDISISSLEFRRCLEQQSLGAENFFVLDCCNGDGMKLPFLWQENKYICSSHPYFSTKKTLCLCSTQPREDSASKITGSVFTDCFLRQLKERKDLAETMESINTECSCYPQTATLYSSRPDLKRFWSWLYTKEEKENKVEEKLASLLQVLLE